METTLKSLRQTEDVAFSLLKKELKNNKRPIVFALYGDLGAGKTTFVRSLAKALGIKEYVTSPTFLLLRVLKLPKKNKDIVNLVHIDAYRIEKAEELIHLGLKEILKDKKNVVAIEWPEKLKNYLPKNTIHIKFNITGPKSRVLAIVNE